MKVKWFAVLYPTERLQTTNDAMRRIECKTQYEALQLCQQWKLEQPDKRAVVRREFEVLT